MFWHRKPTQPTAEIEPTLPSDVRFALKYNENRLTGRHIRQLYRNGFGRLGFYLSMKACEGSPPLQANLLSRVVELDFSLDQLTENDAGHAINYLSSQDPPEVNGQKLASVTSLGIGHWITQFRHSLEPRLQTDPEAPVFMVANAPFIGFDVLANLTLRRDRPLGIIRPNRPGQDMGIAGHWLEPGSAGVNISTLPHDFVRPEGAIVFDDAQASGQSRARVLEFWGAGSEVDFVTAFVDRSLAASAT